MKTFVWVSLFWTISINAVAEQQVKNFTRGSYDEVVNQYQNQPLVMVLWSIDCPPCYKELEMLAREQKQQAFNLVLISTDGADASIEVATVLKKYKLQNIDTWLFEEYSAQHLRYEIDPLWYGELPRSYLFNREHQRQAVSGVLSAGQLSK
jgi:thiol-disulfide isomerase/thioredoxin